MISSYSLVVFDWEGTVVDTLGAVFHIVATESARLNFPKFDFDQAKKYVDLGLPRALHKLYPQLTSVQHEQLVHSVQQAMHSQPTMLHLFPGLLDCLEKLERAGVKLAIATNKGQHALMRALDTTHLAARFPVTRSAGQSPAKPCPQMLQEIIDDYLTTPQQTIMIGDSVTDMEMARSIGVRAIGVDFYHQHTLALEHAGAMAVFDDYFELSKFLCL